MTSRMHVAQVLAKVAVSAFLLAILIVNADVAALRSTLVRVDWLDVLAAIAILIVLTPLLAWRWRHIGQSIGVPLSWRSSLEIVLIGTFFNQVLPSSVGGDAVRVWLLKRAHVPLTKSLSSILLDRVVALFGMVLIVAIGFPWLEAISREPALRLAAATVIAAGLAGISLLLLLDKVPLPRVLSVQPPVALLRTISADARTVFFSPRVLLPSVVASALVHVLVSIAVWVLARSIGLDVGIEVFVLLLPLVLLASLLPISIAGWGVREGAMVACLGLAGVSAPAAFAVSALFGMAYLIAGLPGGAVWIAIGGRSVGKIQTDSTLEQDRQGCR